jgi:uncharacterized protein YdaT
MPWKPSDAIKHNRSLKTPAQRAKWSKVANAVLKSSGDEGMAIAVANKQAKRVPKPKKALKKRKGSK